MKKLFILSLFALTTGLYGDYYPYQGNVQQRGMGFRQGCCGQPACMPQGRHSSMPYTTIVNEDEQGPRQQYYYYGADSQKDEDYDNDDEDDNTYYNVNRDNLRQNIRDRAQNLRGALQDRGLTQDRAQNTYFNRGAQTTAASDTFRSDSDRALGQRIRDAIKGGWFSRGYEQVSLDVNNGIVTLRGFVVSLDDKKKVEDAVKNVNGVNNVRNQLSIADQGSTINGSQNTSTDNRTLTNRSQTSSLDNRTLMNRSQTTNATDDDEDDDDEDDNDNDYPQDRASTAADRQINNNIRNAIGNGWFAKKYEAIVIRTDKGIVTIEGFVDTFDDQRKLNDEIRKIAGVRSVNNNVQVKDKSS